MRTLRIVVSVFLLLASVAAQDVKGLGRMWTFENAPLDMFEKEYGFKPDAAWLEKVRLSSARFGSGCSSSFVSPTGLILTNHHCVRDWVAKVSPKDRDWLKDGFIARALAEEVPIPGLKVQQLVSMEDVTARVTKGGVAGDVAATERNRNAEEAKVVEEAKARFGPGHSPQVTRLYQGGMSMLYVYRDFEDIRLAAVPNLQAAHFGGDPDNFTYPRYGIDFGLVRAYVDGKPADTSAHYLKWSLEGPKDGELVFVTGNPGSTARALTVAQLEYQRDAQLPIRLEFLDRRIEIMEAWVAKDPAARDREVRADILGRQNSQKAFRGFLAGLKDASLMSEKRAFESAFRAKIDADPALKDKFGTIWDDAAAIAKRRLDLEAGLRLHTPEGCRSLMRAVFAARAMDASLPPAVREAAKKQALATPGTEVAYELEVFVDIVERAKARLGAADPFVAAVCGAGSAADGVKALVAGSRFGDDAFLKAVLGDGSVEVAVDEDPAMNVAKVLAPLMQKEAMADARIKAEESALGTRIGQALFAIFGTKIPPDATLTLRIADGVVKGYPMNGTIAPWRTSFYGMYGRSVEFGNHHPFDLPEPYMKAKDKIDMSKFVNFVSTNDIIGGNSGSPIINTRAEVVGLVFDGNIESLPNRYLFRDDVPRTVNVHPDAIIESLKKVYDAGALADELLGKPMYR